MKKNKKSTKPKKVIKDVYTFKEVPNMNDKDDYLASRKKETGNERICKCGGILWEIDGKLYCGDCRTPDEFIK